MTTPGSAAAFAPPAGTLVNFNSGTVSAPFTYTTTGTAGIVSGDSTNNYAEPAFSDGTRYLAVQGGGTATLQSALSFESVSFFLGSIDTFNTVSLLNAAGNVIQSFTGSDFIVPANGNQDLPSTNRRVTLVVTPSEQRIAGVRFSSGVNALEVDNVVFAVPEPTTWALMLLGFGMVGAATRYRRRKIAVAFA
ncbi:PEP-CTERM sorting domain-containing protein [Sphingomonas sp. BT553]|uniref:PEP-CTERM sorting domain-containing protein n=2 Tax=Sphingomonas mollis TaxID=2795726 RepID=A0ABS0XR12_9SPHN|nr:PEP-CTERM sorting domain-containing protein [Sphingomonas sp. BT553]